MKITIPTPCHENWDKMTPDEKGKFCSVCSKSVHDFSTKSDDEIVGFFSNSDESVCGNFNENQLNRNLNLSFLNSFLAKFAVGLILTSGGWVSAQECTVKDSVPKVRRFIGKVKRISSEEIKKPLKSNHSVILRGMPSHVEDKTPLYILDGKVISEQEFRSIDKNKVESVQVLKEEVSTAIYGVKAQFGAVIITTKKKK